MLAWLIPQRGGNVVDLAPATFPVTHETVQELLNINAFDMSGSDSDLVHCGWFPPFQRDGHFPSTKFGLIQASFISTASDRGRGDKGKMRPKSEGFELYNNSVQNGSPESPQDTWDTYPEPKKEDRLLKNRADHRSSPNVASKCATSNTWHVCQCGSF